MTDRGVVSFHRWSVEGHPRVLATQAAHTEFVAGCKSSPYIHWLGIMFDLFCHWPFHKVSWSLFSFVPCFLLSVESVVSTLNLVLSFPYREGVLMTCGWDGNVYSWQPILD